MPRPPLLPTIDWSGVFDSGATYEQWISQAENADHRTKMEESKARLHIVGELEQVIRELAKPVHVVAIAEDWCGDVVRHVPVLQGLAELTENLRVRYLTRDANRDVFVRYLTNGGEAIPKFIFLNVGFVECGNWGPMPDACREIIARGKASGDGKLARELVGKAYEDDPEMSDVVEEIVNLIGVASAASP